MSSFVTSANYLALPANPQKWLIDQLIPSGGLVNLYAKPKVGKSWMALDMSEAIANPHRHTWNGKAVLQHGPVMYLQIDTPRYEWFDRIKALTKRGYDFSQVHVCDALMVPSYPFNILDPLQAKWLGEEIAKIKPVMVWVDTLREAHNGDENDNTVMRNVITSLVKCVLPVGSSMGFAAHQKKETQFMKMGGDDLMDDARGASYVSGKMDNVLKLTPTRLTWKGRAGAGDISVKQDPDTHLIVLDADSQKENEAVEHVIARERGLDPHVTIKDIAIALRKELGWADGKQKSAVRRVTQIYKARGWPTSKKGSTAAEDTDD